MKFHKNEESFQYIKNLLFEDSDRFHSNISIPMYSICKEFIISNMIKNDVFYQSLYELHNVGYSKGLVYQNENIGAPQFYQSSSIIYKVKGLQEATKWVNEMSSKLPESLKDQTVNLSLSWMYIHEEDPDKSLDLLNNVHFSSNKLNRIARKNLLISYYLKYQISDDGFLESQINNFDKYLERHKDQMSSRILEGYQNFSKMMKIMNRGVLISKLYNEIHNLENYSSMTWLLGYLKKLEKSGIIRL